MTSLLQELARANDPVAGPVEPQLLPGLGAHRTLGERAFTVLHEAILERRLAPGSRLRIEDIAHELGMSSAPVREAFRQLDAIGFVRHVPHKGTTVAELSLENLADVYRTRLALEPLAVSLAASAMTDEERAGAARALDDYARAVRDGDVAGGWRAHRSLHFRLYHGAHSFWLPRQITPLWETTERYRRTPEVRGCLSHRQSEHEEILAACLERDGERAGRLMHDHLATTANMFAEAMGVDPLFELRGES